MKIFEIIWRGSILLFLAVVAIGNLVFRQWFVGIVFLFLTIGWTLSTLDSWSLQEYEKRNKKK